MAFPQGNPDIIKRCLPRIVEAPDKCSGFTVCAAVPVTVKELDLIYMNSTAAGANNGTAFRVDTAMMEADFMGKACEIRQNGMYDWLAATRRNWSRSMQGSRKTRGGKLVYEPFVKMGRNSIINNQYWIGTRVTDVGGKTTFTLTSPTGIPANAAMFPPKTRLAISTMSGTAKITGMLVMTTAATTNGTLITVSGDYWGSGGLNLPALPVVGATPKYVVMRGTANVANTDVYCPELPVFNTYSEAYFWVETNRLSMCDSDLTKQFMQRLLEGNALYKKFYHVDDVERNRQILSAWQSQMANQFWYGRATNANQTPSLWSALPPITLPTLTVGDAGFGTACVGYRADAVGVIPQMEECNRVMDYAGAVFDLPTLFRDIYDMKRVRDENNIPTKVFELCTNSHFANQIVTGMLRYYNMRSEGLFRLNQDLSAKFQQNDLGFTWRSFILDFPMGVELRIVTHEFFDDFISVHNANGMPNGGNMAFVLDWSSIYQAVIESKTLETSTGSVQELAKVDPQAACIMDRPEKKYRHRSTTWTAVVECPNASKIYTNFSPLVPDHTE